MSALKVNGTFISEKVSRVRWIPEQYAAPNAFLTGSWESFADASVKVWRLAADSDFSGGGSAVDDDDPDGTVLVPKCVAKVAVGGDISGLEFVDAEHIVATSTDGFASVLRLNRQLAVDNLSESHRFRQLHRFGSDGDGAATAAAAACNAVSPFEHNVATVGEDGRLNVLAINGARVLRSYAAADSCSLTTVSFVSAAEVFVGNRMGTIRMFDLRVAGDVPASSMLISCDDEKKPNGVTALAYHPTQRHILLGGSEEGSITVWDLRNAGFAASYLTAHETAITELAFHPTAPNRLFTAAEGGELFQWSHTVGGVGATRTAATTEGDPMDGGDQTNPWLSGERIKNKINWSPMISGIRKAINTFDASGPKIICGCDNEAVYLVENVY